MKLDKNVIFEKGIGYFIENAERKRKILDGLNSNSDSIKLPDDIGVSAWDVNKLVVFLERHKTIQSAIKILNNYKKAYDKYYNSPYIDATDSLNQAERELKEIIKICVKDDEIKE